MTFFLPARSLQCHPGMFISQCRFHRFFTLHIQNIGGLAGLPFAPYMTDWAGRRKAIFLGAVIST